MNSEEKSKYIEAGKIAAQAKQFAKQIIKKNMPLLEIAEKIDAKISELGAKPAFPVNLCIDDVAAHYTPSHNDVSVAHGLLKVDIGVQVDGYIADTAFSIDLENKIENKKLIESAEKALQNAISAVKEEKNLAEIGSVVQETISSYGFSPIKNLTGHELSQGVLHAGVTIPNYNNGNTKTLSPGKAYAIEPFSTTGAGIVYDSRDSGIYRFQEKKAIRDPHAREILKFIEEEYQTLPFCSRWLVKKFGTRALLSLSLLEKTGILHQYEQLVEKNHAPVAQAEHTILILSDKTKEKVIVTTE